MAIVRYKRSEIPPMSEERKAELRALAERPDSEIDFSDIPELTEEFWKNAMTAEQARFFRKGLYTERELFQSLLGKQFVKWLLKNGEQHKIELKKVLKQFVKEHSSRK